VGEKNGRFMEKVKTKPSIVQCKIFNIRQSIKNVNISSKYEGLFACHFSTAANATIASVLFQLFPIRTQR
jgi:hypothetical protein